MPAAEAGKPQRPSVPGPLVAAALEAYEATKDVRWAVPVLAGVGAGQAAALLPPAAALCDPTAGAALPISPAAMLFLPNAEDVRRNTVCSGSVDHQIAQWLFTIWASDTAGSVGCDVRNVSIGMELQLIAHSTASFRSCETKISYQSFS